MAETSLTGRSVLVVEDEYLIAMEIQDVLQKAQATVIGPVASVGQALALVQTVRLDAAVLDIALGQETSHGIAQELRDRAVPFLVATGNAGVANQPAFRGVPILAKPVHPDEILRTVQELLAASAPAASG